MIARAILSSRPRALAVGLAAVLLAASIVGTGPAANAADGQCSGDTCDGGQWATARGAANEISFWGMDPGHNCTNYVAWKLILNGVARPGISPGDAADWAARAALSGYLVDGLPSVGAVAQWDAFAGGNGSGGHVAYVERLNGDGTILVSEDYWHGGDQSGPLTLRTVHVASVSHFIHYGDVSHWLRQVQIAAAGSHERSTGLNIQPTAMSLVAGRSMAPELFYLQNGAIYRAATDATGWRSASTGLLSSASSLSAVAMVGRTPQLVTVEHNVLYLESNSGAGWQKMNTGIEVTGDISAVDLGGLLPTVMVSQDGSLYRVWGDADGWHSEATGVESWGAISAIYTGGVHPEVFSIASSTLHRAWWDANGWHEQSTGVAAKGSLVAVDVAGTAEVILTENGVVYRIRLAADGWHKDSMGVAAGTALAAMGTGAEFPLILQAG